MARRRGTSRVTSRATQPGSPTESGAQPRPASRPELPSIRQRRPMLFWGLMLAMAGMVLPLILGFIQALA